MAENSTRPNSPATPLFVLGMPRSGTTWLANILCNHPKIAGVVDEKGFGIFESIFFSHFAKQFGDISNQENFTNFVRHFSKCDFFLHTGMTEDWLLKFGPASYEEIFGAIMNELAAVKGADFWLDKSPPHTLLAKDLRRCYPDAWFVCISRNLLDVVLSTISTRLHYMRHGSPESLRDEFDAILNFLKICYRFVLYQKTIDSFSRNNDRCIVISYEDLLNDREAITKRLTSRMGLEFDPGMLTESYRPNASSRKDRVMKNGFDWKRKALAVGVSRLISLVPYAILVRTNEFYARRKGPVWPGWCWRTMPQWAVPGNSKGSGY